VSRVPLALVHTLLSTGRVDIDEIFDSALELRPSSRRHIAYKVVRVPPRSSIFAKVLLPDIESPLSEERLFYEVVRADARFALLRRHLVGATGHEHTGVLDMDLVDADTVRELWLRDRVLPVELCAALGEALAALHNLSPELAQAVGDRKPVIEALPWTLGIGSNFDLNSRNAQATDRKIVSIVRESPAFVRDLESLRPLWRVEGLVHGDMKWDNCLTATSESTWQIWLIDWEGYYLGDTAWDCAGIFADFWIHSIDTTVADLSSLKPGIRSFWSGYHARRAMVDRDNFLHRALLLSCARLVHTVFERGRTTFQVTKPMIRALQFAANLLQNVPTMIRALELA
jgi:hypothetical protein